MKKIDRKIINDFSKLLDDIHYEMIISLAVGDEIYNVPFPHYAKAKRELKKLDMHFQTVVLFFYLGETCDKNTIKSFLGEEIWKYFYEIRLIEFDEDICWMNNVLVIPYMNCYFLVNNLPDCLYEQSAKYKPYLLSRNIMNKVSGKVFVICDDGGLTAILVAKSAKEVVSIYTDPILIDQLQFNAILNHVEHKISFRRGEVENNLDNELFDYIIVSLKFSTLFIDNYMQNYNFEKDNRHIIWTNKIKELKKHLAVNGCIIVVGIDLGNYEYCFLEDDIRRNYENMFAQLLVWDSESISFFIESTIKNTSINTRPEPFTFSELLPL